jgi:nucleotide-binding universal stress UspA family protein
MKGGDMIQHIVVPLDGTKLSESALPTAQELALRCSALLTLIRVVKGTKGYKEVTDYTKPPAQQAAAQPRGGKEKKAEEYLTIIAKKMQDQGIKVQTKVILGEPGEAIAFHAVHNPCDLIVMASHGRSGLSRWARGSVADQVFRFTSKSVLIVRGPSK